MTSKNLFFKVMREDLRHKMWMLALSILTSVLMVLVVWLIWWSNRSGSGAGYETAFGREDGRRWAIEEVISFFMEYVCIMGGIQAMAGALVTGLFGFRHVFHKNMTDTYQSLPVKRDTLFAAGYVNGILIWFLPFAACLLPTAIMAGSFLGQIGGSAVDVGQMFWEAGVSFLNLTVIYLLVYSMVLTAVMLSGNILNTLVSMGILGFGAISAFGICYGFFSYYMENFYDAMDWSMMVYVSPLFTAPALIFWRVEQEGGKMAIAFLVAVILSLCAWQLYRRRPSEMAEQGIRNKTAAAMMRLLAGIVAGTGGWILFIMLAGRWTVFWGIFGAGLALVLAFGVLNIIFAMDFKAFFSHKRQLAAVLAVTLLLCFAFHWDWFNYDHYLPGRDKIAEIAVCDSVFANRYFSSSSEEYPLENMRFQDADTIYACLKRLTDENAVEAGVREGQMLVRVTLNSGRSYYRRYPIYDRDENRDVFWPLLTSEEYLKYAFCVSDEMAERCSEFNLRKGEEREKFRTAFLPDAFEAIVRAYNQDVVENPEGAFAGEGRLLAQMELDIDNETIGSRRITLSIFETMERTVEAMRANGFGEWVEPLEASEIQAIVLGVYGYYEPGAAVDYIAQARETYGVYVPNQRTDAGEGEMAEDISLEAPFTKDMTEWASIEVKITEAAEIEELVPMLSLTEPSRCDRVFRSGYVSVSYLDREGTIRSCYIPRGALPEKYILRFGKYS